METTIRDLKWNLRFGKVWRFFERDKKNRRKEGRKESSKGQKAKERTVFCGFGVLTLKVSRDYML